MLDPGVKKVQFLQLIAANAIAKEFYRLQPQKMLESFYYWAELREKITKTLRLLKLLLSYLTDSYFTWTHK